ncbi:MAG: DEAD/DEAH box helicase [Nitrospiraceae bacterium]|nr:DEAD/DEAH box helicase [Nitrospiraceae bacterium]
MLFDELNIPEPILRGIREAGFLQCTPVQAAALPKALAGRDIAAQAQTGTGKTAVFLITLFSRMLAAPAPAHGPSPRCLVVAPTRELVVQIDAEARRLGQFTDFRIVPVYGGIDYHKQREAVGGNVDMLIGTPGRLIDYLKQRVYSLKKTEFLVIDEADRMFDMGFISDLRFLLRRMSPYDQRQSMLFSATLSSRVMELCYEHMNLPEQIVVTPEQVTVEQIEQELYHVGKAEKAGLLLGIIRKEPRGRILVFTNMKSTAEKLEALFKANDLRAAAITGDLPQIRRMKLLNRFKEGDLPILVATDVASRGLHIEGVTHVINYDLPQDREDYVHRIGRTARAGAVGKAISFACEDYVYALEDIEEYIKQKIPVRPVDDSMIVTDYKRPEFRPRVKGPYSAAARGKGPQRRHAERPPHKPARAAEKPAAAPDDEAKKKKKRRRRKKKPAGETRAGAIPARPTQVPSDLP